MFTRTHSLVIITIGMLLGVGLASRASAQQPSNSIPPESTWKGSSHVVYTISGEEVSGRLVKLGPDDLQLLVKGQVRTWRLDDIAEIDRIRDSRKNGAVIGALVFGALCAFVCGQGLDTAGGLPKAVAANVGLGALIGASIGADHQSRVTVYQKSPPTGNQHARSALLYRFSF